MSSPGLPTLTIDVAARRTERRLVVATLLIVPFAMWQSGLPSAGVLVTFVIACGFVALGWVGGRSRIARIVCRPDGRWSLCEASGRVIDADLSMASRASPHAVWLRWHASRRALLLVRGDIPDNEFRRLLVRLRVAPFPDGGRA